MKRSRMLAVSFMGVNCSSSWSHLECSGRSATILSCQSNLLVLTQNITIKNALVFPFLGSISAGLSCPVYQRGLLSEQRLVIEPRSDWSPFNSSFSTSIFDLCRCDPPSALRVVLLYASSEVCSLDKSWPLSRLTLERQREIFIRLLSAESLCSSLLVRVTRR